MNSEKLPWVVFRLMNENYALGSLHVTAILNQMPVTKMPNTPGFVKGIIRYRDEIFKLLDLRIIAGMESLDNDVDAFQTMLAQREEDHRRWLNELEKSVEEGREFKLATDPHKCAFGKWYYSYNTDNLSLSRLLGKFENPHNTIHSIAKAVEELKNQGNLNGAKELIAATHDKDLRAMISLFDELKNSYRESLKEKIILLKNDDDKCALVVDGVIAVEEISETNVENSEAFRRGNREIELTYTIGKRNNGEFVMLLEAEQFLTGNLI